MNEQPAAVDNFITTPETKRFYHFYDDSDVPDAHTVSNLLDDVDNGLFMHCKLPCNNIRTHSSQTLSESPSNLS